MERIIGTYLDKYNILAKYTHGSADSVDNDVVYVFDTLPNREECKIFCSGHPDENRNIITINDEKGIVSGCYKGTIDEINNSLIRTYFLHPQDYALRLTHTVKRNFILKAIRCVRIILSYLTRTEYRSQIKKVLHSQNWEDKFNYLYNFDLSKISYSNLGKDRNPTDVLKIIAFQLGQTLLLERGIEAYTKKEVADFYPDLKQALYRDNPCSYIHSILEIYKNKLCDILYADYPVKYIEEEGLTWFLKENKKFDVVKEKEVEYTVGPVKYDVYQFDLKNNFRQICKYNEESVLLTAIDTDKNEDVIKRYNRFIAPNLVFNEYYELDKKYSLVRKEKDEYRIRTITLNDEEVSRIAHDSVIWKKFIDEMIKTQIDLDRLIHNTIVKTNIN